MEKLITDKEKYHYLTNELSNEMDSYLTYKNHRFKTYIMDEKFKGSYAIKYPELTVGCVKVNDNNITIF